MYVADFRTAPIRFILWELAKKSTLRGLELGTPTILALADFITD